MPRVAAKIDTQMISDIIEILSEDTFNKLKELKKRQNIN